MTSIPPVIPVQPSHILTPTDLNALYKKFVKKKNVNIVGRPMNKILAEFHSGEIKIPEWQRKPGAWSLDHKSNLIDSCMKGYPIPALIILPTEDGKSYINDGVQRLTTFLEFTENKFPWVITDSKEDQLLLSEEEDDTESIPPTELKDTNNKQTWVYYSAIPEKYRNKPARGKFYATFDDAKRNIFGRVSLGMTNSEEHFDLREHKVIFGRLQKGVPLNTAEKMRKEDKNPTIRFVLNLFEANKDREPYKGFISRIGESKKARGVEVRVINDVSIMLLFGEHANIVKFYTSSKSTENHLKALTNGIEYKIPDIMDPSVSVPIQQQLEAMMIRVNAFCDDVPGFKTASMYIKIGVCYYFAKSPTGALLNRDKYNQMCRQCKGKDTNTKPYMDVHRMLV